MPQWAPQSTRQGAVFDRIRDGPGVGHRVREPVPYHGASRGERLIEVFDGVDVVQGDAIERPCLFLCSGREA